MRLLEAGLITDRRVGRSRLVTATQSPLSRALANLLVHGYGPKPVTENALRKMPGVEKAFCDISMITGADVEADLEVATLHPVALKLVNQLPVFSD